MLSLFTHICYRCPAHSCLPRNHSYYHSESENSYSATFVSAHTCSPASPGCSRQANRKKFALADSRSLTCSRQISGSIPHPFGKTCVSAVPSKVCIENAVSVFCILLLCPPQPLALKLTRHTTLTKPRQSSFTSNCNPSLAKFLQLPTIREKLL